MIRGAGILILARNTERVLLLQRGDDVSEPGRWALPGGKIDEGETPRVAAVRELEEEAGYDGQITVLKEPIFVYRGDDLEFSTYFAYVEREFEPQLNWESEDAGWFYLRDLPQPLHFGMVALMRHGKRRLNEEISRIIRWPALP
jgi:mutator protein MutT